MKNKVQNILNSLGINQPPISVEKVAELFSLDIAYYPKFPDSVSGTIIQENGINAIGVNKNHHPNRQRFTIAHELGHYVLGHDSSKIVDDTFDKDNDKEREANKFAGELLMPRDFLKKDIVENAYDIPLLAERYQVSEQAMSVRLLETNLIDKIKLPK